MIYLLDTDTFIVMARGSKADAKPATLRTSARKLVEHCRRAQQGGDHVGLSALSLAELEHGARRGGRYVEEMAVVRKMLTPLELFSFDALTSPWHYGKIRHELEAAGKLIGSMDLLIAAHALSLHATMVTNNRDHFDRVRGLRTASWA